MEDPQIATCSHHQALTLAVLPLVASMRDAKIIPIEDLEMFMALLPARWPCIIINRAFSKNSRSPPRLGPSLTYARTNRTFNGLLDHKLQDICK
jgi:hypothetical protein